MLRLGLLGWGCRECCLAGWFCRLAASGVYEGL